MPLVSCCDKLGPAVQAKYSHMSIFSFRGITQTLLKLACVNGWRHRPAFNSQTDQIISAGNLYGLWDQWSDSWLRRRRLNLSPTRHLIGVTSLCMG